MWGQPSRRAFEAPRLGLCVVGLCCYVCKIKEHFYYGVICGCFICGTLGQIENRRSLDIELYVYYIPLKSAHYSQPINSFSCMFK